MVWLVVIPGLLYRVFPLHVWKLNVAFFTLFFQILICRDTAADDLQVDVDMIDGLLASLVEYLQLENAYNIFILNPKRDEGRPKYGYR